MTDTEIEVTEIERELQKATQVKPAKDQKRSEFLEALARAIEPLSDEVWDDLSKPAQLWANAAAKAVENQQPVPDFNDNEAGEAAEHAAKQEEGKVSSKKSAKKSAPSKGASKSASSKGAKKPAPAKAAVKPATKPAVKSEGKLEGVKVNIKRLILANTSVTVDEIMSKLGKAGTSSKVTVSNIRAEFRHSLRVLKQEGKLKGVEI